MNVRVEVKQGIHPETALKLALHRFRKECSPILKELKAREYFISESRQRREKNRKAKIDRKALDNN